MGGSKKGEKSTPGADAQMRIAEQIFEQTDPLRSALIGRSADFLGVGGLPTSAAGGLKDGGIPGGLSRVAGQAAGQLPGSPAGSGGGGIDVMNTPTFGAYKSSADRLFSQGKDNALARLPAGGALTEALVDLEGQRASTLTQGAGAIYGDELSRAMSLATGGTGQSLNSLGQAGAIQAQMAANRAQVQSSKYESFGQAAGTAYGMK